jgi:hypothetical protein
VRLADCSDAPASGTAASLRVGRGIV